jgi:hypothetical protein
LKLVITLSTVVGLSLVAACHGDDSSAPAQDAGLVDGTTGDASLDAPLAADVPEPPWSGQTVEPDCQANGCIRELTQKAVYDKALLANVAANGQRVDNGVTVYFIRYMSNGGDEITGSVYVPDVDPPAGGYPVVVMNQFTSGIGAPCAPSKGYLGVGVATATALRGILTIVPDATSYGPPPLGVYLAAPPAGRAALDAARAAFHLGPALGKSIARRAVVAGLSQGAHSTMAAAAELLSYAPNLEIRGFAAVAPPANFRDSTNKVFQSGAGSGFYLAMRLYTWQTYYAFDTPPVFREPYASQAEAWFEKECQYVGSTGKDGTLPSHFPSDPNPVFSDAYLTMGKNDSWSAGWAAAFDAATPIPRGVSVPIVIFQGTADTTVPKVGTDVYVEELAAAGVSVDYRLIDGSEHTTTAFAPLTVEQKASDEAYAWVQAHLAQ